MGKSYGGRRSRERIDARSTTYSSYAAKRLGRSRPKLVQTLIWTMGRSYGGRRSRVCIDARAERANVRTEPHIQNRRSNGKADRGPHWYKHFLGQWAEDMGVGDRECALMRAQTCAQHHLSSIGARRSGPIEPQIRPKIGRNTHWDNAMTIGGSAIASAHLCALCARKRARSTTYPA
jgi:hypothetical protein